MEHELGVEGKVLRQPETVRGVLKHAEHLGIIIIDAGQIRILTMLFKYFCQTPAKKKNNENNHILIFKNNGSTKSF